jgi:hypothetical protein
MPRRRETGATTDFGVRRIGHPYNEYWQYFLIASARWPTVWRGALRLLKKKYDNLTTGVGLEDEALVTNAETLELIQELMYACPR